MSNDNDLKTLNPKGVEIEIGGRTFTVRPLVVRDFEAIKDDMAKCLDVFLEETPDFDLKNIKSVSFTEILPAVTKSMNEFLGVLAVGLKAEKEFLRDNMTLENMSDAVLAILVQNGLDRVIRNFTETAALMGLTKMTPMLDGDSPLSSSLPNTDGGRTIS